MIFKKRSSSDLIIAFQYHNLSKNNYNPSSRNLSTCSNIEDKKKEVHSV